MCIRQATVGMLPQMLIMLTCWCSASTQYAFVAVREAGACYTARNTMTLGAKKKTRQVKKATTNTRGFGGVATAPCRCGSGTPYTACCGVLHQDAAALQIARPSQIVRARYSAYSMRNDGFILASTHPENSSYEKDIDHWKTTMQQGMYDNFVLSKCDILDESDVSNVDPTDVHTVATVRFRAHLLQRDTKESSSFVELSTFQRTSERGPWLYKRGDFESDDSR